MRSAWSPILSWCPGEMYDIAPTTRGPLSFSIFLHTPTKLTYSIYACVLARTLVLAAETPHLPFPSAFSSLTTPRVSFLGLRGLLLGGAGGGSRTGRFAVDPGRIRVVRRAAMCGTTQGSSASPGRDVLG